jgi:ATP/maltotriose-dependent transcriptional regulator MalT
MIPSRPPEFSGSARLTRREAEVMKFVVFGYRSKEIADILVVSKRTIDYHIAGVFSKLGVCNRLQAIRAVQHLGLVPFEPRFDALDPPSLVL